jgi:hypothetical protein
VGFICVDCGTSPIPHHWIVIASVARRHKGFESPSGEFVYECTNCGKLGFREDFDGVATYYDRLLNLPMGFHDPREKEIRHTPTPSFLLKRGNLVK